jgi:hypothetical protein
MKVRSELKAGRTFQECAQERDWWKRQAVMMEEFANSNKTTPPTGLWFPGAATQLPGSIPSGSTSGSTTGKFYPDMSGVCR